MDWGLILRLRRLRYPCLRQPTIGRSPPDRKLPRPLQSLPLMPGLLLNDAGKSVGMGKAVNA